MKDGFPVSVAELIAAGSRPLPGEAVAILLDVCDQVVRRPAGGSVLPAITPSALFLDGSGTVTLAGGVPAEDDQTVQLLGRLLLHMLPAPGTAGAIRVPSRLRELAARAAGGELQKLSVGRLAASLRRFAPEQSRIAVRALFERWREGNPSSATSIGSSDFSLAASLPVCAVREADDTVSHPAAGKSHRRLAGALVAALLILASAGAAYWLSADTTLPPVPLSPSLLSEPQPPPRGGWELLDPAGLAVDARPDLTSGQPAPSGRDEKKDKRASGVQSPETGGSHRPVQ